MALVIIGAIIVSIIICLVVETINGDDSTPWPHPQEDDEHRWV